MVGGGPPRRTLLEDPVHSVLLRALGLGGEDRTSEASGPRGGGWTLPPRLPVRAQVLATQGGKQGCLLGRFMWNFLKNQVLALLNY